MTSHIGDCANDADCVAAAVVSGRWSIKGPGYTLFHSLVCAGAGDDWRGCIHDCHLLAARAAVAASIGCRPCSGRVESGAAMTSHISDCADDRDRVAAAVVSGRWSIKGPGCTLFNSLVCAGAGDDWRGCIYDSDFLAARAAVAASIGCRPGSDRIESGAAMTGHIGDCADDRDRVAAAVIGGSWSIKGPGCTLFDSLVCAGAGDDWRGCIHNCHLLAARAAVAAIIGGRPGSGRIES